MKIQQSDLQSRWFAARAWLLDRGVTNYMSVLKAHYPDLGDREDVIRRLWNARLQVSTEHLPILTKVEAIIETIKNQPNAA